MALSILNDLLFRKCFSSAGDSEVTKNFITDVLGLEVEEITIENPYAFHEFTNKEGEGDLRTTEVDVLVRLKDQRLVNVELQRVKQKFFIERSAHYIATRFAEDYGRIEHQRSEDKGDSKYSSLYPIYFVGITGFELFDDDCLEHHFTMCDMRTGALLKDEGLFHLCYIELGKEPSANLKHWIGFFLNEPVQADAPDYILRAYELVNYANLSESERKMISVLERQEQDRIGQLAYARNEGREQGREQGRQEGRQEGKQEALLQTAHNFLAQGVSPEVVQKATGLTLEEIQKLQAPSNN